MQRLPPGVDPAAALGTYKRLLAEAKRVHDEQGDGGGAGRGAYNVAMTAEWMCVIPRRRGGVGAIGANTLGMLGVVWVGDQCDRDAWTELGLEKHLEVMGYPRGGT